MPAHRKQDFSKLSGRSGFDSNSSCHLEGSQRDTKTAISTHLDRFALSKCTLLNCDLSLKIYENLFVGKLRHVSSVLVMPRLVAVSQLWLHNGYQQPRWAKWLWTKQEPRQTQRQGRI
mmetsp:Transcript_146/g.532  ORF Transcript_146/g.532 Transcript_146/m.532 type:complete len:118 (+) Transcript_146:209-562(+)